MIDDEMRTELKKLDDRLARVEQFLPSVTTKDDLRNFATKDDVRHFATKDDLGNFATKDDLRNFATKDDLETLRVAQEATLASKADLLQQRRELDGVIATLATRDDMLASAEQTRRHFDVVAESLRDEIRLALEGNLAGASRVGALEVRHDRLERRVTALEAPAPRRKK